MATGVEAFSAGDYDTALELFKDYVATNADDPGGHQNLALTYLKLQDFQGAVASYTKAIELLDKHPARDNTNIKAQCLRNSGVAYQNLGRKEEAVECFRQVIELDSELAEAEVLCSVASAYQETDPDYAISCCALALQKGLNSDDQRAKVYRLVGDIHVSKGDPSNGIAYLWKSIEYRPSDATAAACLTNMSVAFQGQGNSDAAILCCKAALKIDKENLTTWTNLAFALLQQSDYSAALACYQEMLTLDPDDTTVKHNISSLVASGTTCDPFDWEDIENANAEDLEIPELNNTLLDNVELGSSRGISTGTSTAAPPGPLRKKSLAPVGASMYFPLSTLQKRKGEGLPDEVNTAEKEKYLRDEDFQNTFQISKGEFYNLPKWKQQRLKKDQGLF